MLPMVYDAMKKQELKTQLRSKYVFLNPDDGAFLCPAFYMMR
jgi:hypothetical protein